MICRCTGTDLGTDAYGCDEHSEAQRQWELDHPDGVITDEESEAMTRYAVEACAEEAHACPLHDHAEEE